MHEYYMKEALKEARKAESIYEVPIGAILVYKGEIIARGYNRVETDRNPLAHAELLAISEASKYLGGWRLVDTSLYVTLEPCPMCAGAIVNSRIENVFIGARDEKRGCAGSNINLLDTDFLNHKVKLHYGILEKECSSIISNFFKKLRKNK